MEKNGTILQKLRMGLAKARTTNGMGLAKARTTNGAIAALKLSKDTMSSTNG